MLQKSIALFVSLAFAHSLAAAPDTPPAVAQISAAEVVAKNVAARGGLQAWRSVHTISLAGKLGAGGNQRATLPISAPDPKFRQQMFSARPAEEAQLPFVLELERPRKMRMEIQFNGQTAVQVYDGANGWKLRPFLNRLDVEPYTEEEMKIASMQADLDGPLVDYEAKGTQIELAGMEKVEDRDTYKLKLTMKNGHAIHVWIDAQTFLEAKIEGQPRRLDGTYHPVEVYYRDYRTVDGLQIPFVLETRVLPVAKTVLALKDPAVPPEKAIIEKVVVNPKLDEAMFSKAGIVAASKAK
jgi:hypothetical protein